MNDKNISTGRKKYIVENGMKLSIPSLALPRYFENLFILMLGSFNTFVLSYYDQIAVAGVGISDQILGMGTTILSIISTGATVIMSVRIGAGEKKKAEEIAGTGVLLLLALSVLGAIFMFLCKESLLNFMNAESEGKAFALPYFTIRSLCFPITLFFSYFTGRLIACGYTKYCLITSLTSAVTNAGISYIVIFHPDFLPVNGVVGIATANVTSHIVGLSVALFLYFKSGYKLRFTLNPKHIGQIFKIGVPACVSNISYATSQLITTSFIASMGMSMVTAKVIFYNLSNYVYMVSGSIGTAASVLLGRFKGNADLESGDYTYKRAIKIAVSFNIVLAAALFIFRVPLVSLFTDNQEIISLSFGVMLVEIFLEISRAVNNVSDQCLNAVGDIIYTPAVAMISCWVFGVFMSYILGIRMGFMLVGCWAATGLDETFRAIMYSIRWRGGKWKNKIV